MVSLHVPVVTSQRCLALDEYFLSRTHPAHRDLTRIEVQLVGCRTIYEFLAITDENWSKRGKGREDPAVHIYGGSSYGANLTPQETQDWFAGLLESLQIGTAVTAAHFDDTHGRFDFHLLVPYYDPQGRALKPDRESLRGFVRKHVCAMTEQLNDRRLDAGNSLTIGNLNSAWMVYYKEREPKLEPVVGKPGPAREPTQPAPPVDEPPVAAAVAPQIKAEPAPLAEEGEIAGNQLFVSSPGITAGGRAGSGAPGTAVPSGQDVSKATVQGSVVPAVPDATTSAAPPANKPISTPARVAADPPAEIVPVTALAEDRLGKSLSQAESGTSTSNETAQPARAGPAMTKGRAPSADDSSANSKDDDEAKRKREADAALIRKQQAEDLRLVDQLLEIARNVEEQAEAEAEALLKLEIAKLFEKLVGGLYKLKGKGDPVEKAELEDEVGALCRQLLQKHLRPLPAEGSKGYSALLDEAVELATVKRSPEGNDLIAAAEAHISLLKERSVDHGMDKNS